jgi:hypothetical protein
MAIVSGGPPEPGRGSEVPPLIDRLEIEPPRCPGQPPGSGSFAPFNDKLISSSDRL